MTRAIWNGEIIAESSKIREIEGVKYFPPNSVKKEFLKKSYTHYVCPVKGKANYFNLAVKDKVNWNAAWYYHEPNKDVSDIKDYIAFSPVVEIEN